MTSDVKSLASYTRCQERMAANWAEFGERRRQRLVQQQRHGLAAEKVAENIIEDLFTGVLDWQLSDLNNQLDYADLVLIAQGVKYLLVELKRPGALAWNRRAVAVALDQACRYAAEQKVRQVAISDGYLLYAAELAHGGLHDRALVNLAVGEPDEQLFWLSVHGIYRPRPTAEEATLRLLPEREAAACTPAEPIADALLHAKYRLPAACFAYVGNAAKPSSWKLPYRLADGSIDQRRLPKAVQAILSNYRGVKVAGIPEADIPDIPDVLVRLACAVATLGKMPGQGGETAAVYHQLAEALDQGGRLNDVRAT
ncbi:MAG: hypothetical protein ACLQUT_10675 [Thermoleophilia bacterium]